MFGLQMGQYTYDRVQFVSINSRIRIAKTGTPSLIFDPSTQCRIVNGPRRSQAFSSLTKDSCGMIRFHPAPRFMNRKKSSTTPTGERRWTCHYCEHSLQRILKQNLDNSSSNPLELIINFMQNHPLPKPFTNNTRYLIFDTRTRWTNNIPSQKEHLVLGRGFRPHTRMDPQHGYPNPQLTNLTKKKVTPQKRVKMQT